MRVDPSALGGGGGGDCELASGVETPGEVDEVRRVCLAGRERVT